MKPLEYHAPGALDDAVRLSAEAGASPLAGGTDLIVQHRMGRVEVAHMVDLKKIPELNVLEFDKKSGLRLGAAVPCAALAECEPIGRLYPSLLEGAELIGSTQIQSRASVGGNLCNGSPAADTICALIVLDAVCVIQGANGSREVAAKDFMTGPGETALNKGELLVEIRVPPPAPLSGNGYLRFIPRNEMDIAVVCVAAHLVFDKDRETCLDAKIAVGAAAPTPLLVEQAGRALIGSKLDEPALKAAAQAASKAVRPIDDARGTAEYRRHMAGVLTRRAVGMAVNRFKESG
ncbi:MAG: xanthine dehydrogenase family protein subunit M [SAR324 cluster bacterium]|nr:xanthine dehydrogenase family protein subunit M [SAR324 cluster bacterium]